MNFLFIIIHFRVRINIHTSWRASRRYVSGRVPRRGHLPYARKITGLYDDATIINDYTECVLITNKRLCDKTDDVFIVYTDYRGQT